MKILLTGATGYIGKRILPVLVRNGYHVICCVRDKNRFGAPAPLTKNIEIIEVDFLDPSTLKSIPKDIDAAYYLIHSMSTSRNYQSLEIESAKNFRSAIEKTSAQHIIYLSGIVNEKTLSKHLNSRKAVEEELQKGSYNFTTLRAGIIIGSGSASFEIIRDLVEKLPVMVAPKWLNTKCQPIGITDVINILHKTLFFKKTYNKNFDIGGPDILTYKEMLLGYAKERGLKRSIFIVPVMTPKISSYWLYFITATSYKLATSLVDSMKVEVIARDDKITHILNIQPESYRESIRKTLTAVESNNVVSSWKDSFISGRFNFNVSAFIKVPEYGTLTDKKSIRIDDPENCIHRVWNLGGKTGWYYADWLWRIRGFIDKVFGGVGLRRGRTHPEKISVGDSIDFWRVLYANKKEGRLLLFAEMKLPGEAWLEFKIEDHILYQNATFRPKGLAGRLYWYSIYPLHALVFRGMIHSIGNC